MLWGSTTQAYSLLKKRMVRYASTGPQRLPDWNKSAGGIEAFYFKDPDGHTLEILQFPPDKGPERWHKPTRQLFLGIDHTAIVVRDTDTSLRLYRDLLGFKVAGESVNYGIEQEHLNNVMGAKLRITRMTPPSGPSIEFLEYLTPRDGKPAPDDTKGNDLWHWQTRIRVENVEATAQALHDAGCTFVSPDSVRLPSDALGFTKGVTVRDPDGHELQLVTP
jgi:catechol 2,3-dioxygenase-like lactoylglutathione lyase family enzyme